MVWQLKDRDWGAKLWPDEAYMDRRDQGERWIDRNLFPANYGLEVSSEEEHDDKVARMAKLLGEDDDDEEGVRKRGRRRGVG